MKILKNSELKLIISEPIKEVTSELQTLAINMLATMKMNKGVGLSGPQVGRYIRVIVFEVENDFGYMFNPEIIDKSDQIEPGEEGCLSFPKQICKVMRNYSIQVKYLDLTNKVVVRSFTGLIARVLQHEIDHLHGITMHDRETKNEI